MHGTRWLIIAFLLVIPLGLLTCQEAVAGDSDDLLSERSELALERATAYIWSQRRDQGDWLSASFENAIPKGATALAAYTLSEVDQPETRHLLELAANTLKDRSEVTTVFARSFSLMLWCSLSPDDYWRRVEEDVRFLGGHQHKDGSWGYGVLGGDEAARAWKDHSNTQIALMALNRATELGAEVRGNIWRRAKAGWFDTQNSDGGWGYPIVDDPDLNSPMLDSYGTMTSAGIASLSIIYKNLHLGAQLPFNGRFKARCGKENDQTTRIRLATQKATQWLVDNYQVKHVPALSPETKGSFIEASHPYYLYTLARTAKLMGADSIAGNEWYCDIASTLIETQQVDGSWGTLEETCFAVLALLEARRPALVTKLSFGKDVDWNRDPYDLANLLTDYERLTGVNLSWQTTSIDDLGKRKVRTPILYITGHDFPALTDSTRSAIQNHVLSGGTLLGSACCSSPEFKEAFLQMASELFPMFEQGTLPNNHPLWSIEAEVAPDDDVIALGNETAMPIILLPNGACCAWHQDSRKKHGRLFDLGINILSYASFDTALPNRVESAEPISKAAPLRRIRIARLKHGGDWWSELGGLRSLSNRLARKIGVGLHVDPSVAADEVRRDGTQVLWLTGRTFEPPTNTNFANIKNFLDAGGTLLASATGGAPQFDEAFQKWALELFGADSWEQIPATDPLMTGSFAPNLASTMHRFRYRRVLGGGPPAHIDWPVLYGIRQNGRWAVVYSKYDLACAISRRPVVDCVGYEPHDADTMVANILLYAAGSRAASPADNESTPDIGDTIAEIPSVRPTTPNTTAPSSP